MNPLHTPTPSSSPCVSTFTAASAATDGPWHTLALMPSHPVQVLDFRAGEIALLEVEQGCAWVTCDGVLEDYFLSARQRLSFAGPVRVRVGAEGQRPARLLWSKHKAAAGAAYPAAPAVAVAAPLNLVMVVPGASKNISSTSTTAVTVTEPIVATANPTRCGLSSGGALHTMA